MSAAGLDTAGRHGARALEPAARIARALTPVARWTCWLSLGAGGVLSYALWKWLALTPAWTAVAALLVGAPGLLYAFVWWLLSALGEMPERLRGAVGAVQTAATHVAASDVSRGRRTWQALGDAINVADAADDVMLPIGSVLLFANPLGLLVLGLGFAAAVLLWIVALPVGLILLF